MCHIRIMPISLRDALQITEDKSRNFDIEFVSFDEARKKGGEVIELTGCIRTGASHSMTNNNTISVVQPGRNKHPYAVHIHLIKTINKQEIYV